MLKSVYFKIVLDKTEFKSVNSFEKKIVVKSQTRAVLGSRRVGEIEIDSNYIF